MHTIIFNLSYWLLVRGLSRLPPATTDGLCRMESEIPWPKQQRLVPELAVRLGCSRARARRILARSRANEHCARIDAVRWSRGLRADRIHVRFVGIERLHQAAALRRGVIVAMPHTSAVSVAVWPAQRIAASLGYRVHAFAWEAPPERAAATQALGYTDPAQGGSRGTLAMLRALSSGAIVATAVDYPSAAGPVADLHRRWLTHRFLGRWFAYSPGIAALARRAQAPILPAIPFRRGPAQYSVRFLLPLPPPKTEADEADVMHMLLNVLEAEVRAEPEQYSPWFFSFPPLQVRHDGGRPNGRGTA